MVAVHPDPASMEIHMQVAGPAFCKFSELIDLQRIDVFGSPSEESLKQLQQKAKMLGGATVTVHEKHAGFARFGGR